MKLRTIIKGANGVAILGVLVIVFMLPACGSGVGDKIDSGSSQANVIPGDKAGVVAASSPTPTAANATAMAKPMPQGPAQARNNGNRNTSGAPKPQIGTGGNDFFQFTQARAAIGADPDLKTTNIVIDVKGGVLTLSGTVANAAQKSKAEQLMRAVAGVKKVNNGLQITK